MSELVDGLKPVDPALLKDFIEQRKKDTCRHVWGHFGIGSDQMLCIKCGKSKPTETREL